MGETGRPLHIVQIGYDDSVFLAEAPSDTRARQKLYAQLLDEKRPGSRMTLLILTPRPGYRPVYDGLVTYRPVTGWAVLRPLRLFGELFALNKKQKIDVIATQTIFVEAWIALAFAAFTQAKVVGQLHMDVFFSNGLERQTEWACRAARRPYALKVVGDVAWERARNEGLTQLPVDDFQHAPPAAKPVRLWMARRTSCARRARLVVTPSEYLRRMVIGWGVEARKVFTVRNGIRLDEFARFAPRRRGAEVFEIVFIGRLVNWKGVDHLLRAIVALRDVHLSLVGDGPEAPSLRALAGNLGLNTTVDFCGALPADKVSDRLARAHVLALPSEYEGLSHALLEACAASIPCVASDRGGNPEVIEHERSGLLVPYGDVPALRAALQRLQADEDFRFALARGAKTRSRAFDFRATVAETMKLLTA